MKKDRNEKRRPERTKRRKSAPDNWEESRRKKVLAASAADERSRRIVFRVALASAVALIVVLGGYYGYSRLTQSSLAIKQFDTVESVNLTAVAIPASSIGATAKWYEWDIGGTTVRFFAVKDGNGTLHTAFDECPLCYSRHLGYRQEGDAMMENCCEMSWPIDMIGPNCTGCHPAYLPSLIEGGQVLISKSDLGAGAYMFK